MLKGIEAVRKQQEEYIQNFSKDKIRNLMIGDKEFAVFRFISDKDDFIDARAHDMQVSTPKGMKWAKNKYCTEDRSCTYCAQGNDSKEKLFFWIYVYYINHSKQNQYFEKNPTREEFKWAKTQDNLGNIYFKEEVNSPMIFCIGVGKDGVYKKTITSWINEWNTLTDRDYKITRSGEGINTIYSFIYKEAKPFDANIALQPLPDLEKVVKGEVTTFTEKEPGVAVLSNNEIPVEDEF